MFLQMIIYEEESMEKKLIRLPDMSAHETNGSTPRKDPVPRRPIIVGGSRHHMSSFFLGDPFDEAEQFRAWAYDWPDDHW